MADVQVHFIGTPTADNPLGLFPASTDNPFPVTVAEGLSTGIIATRIDEASATITYVGKAAVGADPADPVWRIFRMDTGTTPQTIITWADGNGDYDNVWNNRASLSYS